MDVKEKEIKIKNRPIEVKTVVGLPIRKNEVVEMLAACYAENILELEEYERRIIEVEKAISLEEINSVILDLPNSFLKNLTIFEKEEMKSLPHTKDKDVISKTNFNKRKGKLGLRKNTQKSIAILGERMLSGNLITSNELYLVAIMGSIKVDLTGVNLPDEITITLTAIMGEIKIHVPRNVRVLFDVTPIMGEVKSDKYLNSEVRDNSPIVKIKGNAIMAEVRVITS